MRTVTVDEGWAWGVPVGGFIANFIVGGLAKSFGIIMKSTQELFDADAGPLTLAGGLIYEFMYCLSLLSIFLSEKYGCWKVITVGAGSCVVSFVCAFFSRSVTMWVCAIGGGVGVSLAFIYSPIFVMVGRCFNRRVGVAMGLSVAGVSVGQILFPTIISYVIDQYGARGGYLIGAGIVSHFFITAVLMPRYIIDPRTTEATAEVKLLVEEDEKAPLKGNNNESVDHTQKKEKKPGMFSSLERIHVVMLVIYITAKTFGDVGDVGVAFALPLYGGPSGLDLTNQDISYAIAGAGGVDLLSRVAVGLVSDQTWCRRSLLLLAAWFIEAINTFCFLWFPTYAGFFVFYGIFGACSGTAITLMTVVLTDLVSQKNLPVGFALMMFIVGLFMGAGQFLVGHIKDVTGNYDWSLRYLGSNLLLATFFLALEYPVKWFFFNTRKKLATGKLSQDTKKQNEVTKTNGDFDDNNDLENGNIVAIKDRCHGDGRQGGGVDPRSRLSSISTLSNELGVLVKTNGRVDKVGYHDNRPHQAHNDDHHDNTDDVRTSLM